jgi:hypothetical protein
MENFYPIVVPGSAWAWSSCLDPWSWKFQNGIQHISAPRTIGITLLILWNRRQDRQRGREAHLKCNQRENRQGRQLIMTIPEHRLGWNWWRVSFFSFTTIRLATSDLSNSYPGCFRRPGYNHQARPRSDVSYLSHDAIPRKSSATILASSPI